MYFSPFSFSLSCFCLFLVLEMFLLVNFFEFSVYNFSLFVACKHRNHSMANIPYRQQTGASGLSKSLFITCKWQENLIIIDTNAKTHPRKTEKEFCRTVVLLTLRAADCAEWKKRCWNFFLVFNLKSWRNKLHSFSVFKIDLVSFLSIYFACFIFPFSSLLYVFPLRTNRKELKPC